MTANANDWNEMVGTLKAVEKSIAALSDGDFKTEMEKSRQALAAFHSTAGTLGLAELQGAGLALEKYFQDQLKAGASMDTWSAFGFGISLLADQVKDMGAGKSKALDIAEIEDIIGPLEIPAIAAPVKGPPKAAPVAPPPKTAPPRQVEAAPAETKPQATAPANGFAKRLETSRFAAMIKNLGGELSISSNGGGAGKFVVTFTGTSESLLKLDELLAFSETSPEPDQQMDNKIEKILARGQEFMAAFSSGEMNKAQEILLCLADQQQTGLYKEIGGLARGLHDSITSFMHTMDPSFKEIVENKIPDTGNRLEHMMKLTENAANTTLDHVDYIQERLEMEQEQLRRLRQIFCSLKPVGKEAVNRINETYTALDSLEGIIADHKADLDVILTAQDFQDLSGQIIQKITDLLKDLELKLVNMIKTFGVKSETVKKKDPEELYGPAHGKREDSVHSQDEVDALLAEFGF